MEVGEEVLFKYSLHQYLLASSQRLEGMGPSGREVAISPICEVGVASSIPGRISCKRTWKGHFMVS